MEEILSNIISASKRKIEDDVENEEEIVNLLENLANFTKDLNCEETSRILSTEVLKAFHSFESPRVKENATEIIEKSLPAPGTLAYFSNLQILLFAGFFEQVALNKLLRDISEHKFVLPKEIETRLISFLMYKETSIATPSESLLIRVYDYLDLNESRNLTAQFLAKLTTSDAEQACRILEIAVQVSLKSNEHLRQMEEIISFCLNHREWSHDFLFQMNLLEILQKLFQVEYGFEYLERKGVMKSYAEQILNPDKALLVPGIMTFFTHAALRNPRRILNEYSGLVELLLLIIRDEESFEVVALETLGQIFLTNDSKKILHEKYDELCCQTLRKLFTNIPNYPSDYKSRVFECLEKVFTTDDDTNVNNQITYICERWFQQSSITFTSLMNYCKQPFQDISIASLRLVRTLLSFTFARLSLAQTGGFVEFLLDRNAISAYDVAVVKYQIITKLSTATEFDVSIIALFSNYVRNGVYYNDQNSTAVYYE